MVVQAVNPAGGADDYPRLPRWIPGPVLSGGRKAVKMPHAARNGHSDGSHGFDLFAQLHPAQLQFGDAVVEFLEPAALLGACCW